jgi:flagellar motor switch protein FliM
MNEPTQEETILRMPETPELAECRPELLLPSQSDLAGARFQSFLDGLTGRLPGCLGISGEVHYAGSQQGPLSMIPEEPGSCRVLLDLSPAPGQAQLLISRSLVSATLEAVLGAPEDLESESHEFLTDLDLKLLDGFISAVCDELQMAWRPMTNASFRRLDVMSRQSDKPELPEQSVLVLSGEVVIRGGGGPLHLVVPSLFVRLASETGASGPEPGSGSAVGDSNLLLEALGSVSVQVDVVIHGSDIRIRDLLALKEGAVLMLPRQAGTPLEGQVNRLVKMRGSLISNGGLAGFEFLEKSGGERDVPSLV